MSDHALQTCERDKRWPSLSSCVHIMIKHSRYKASEIIVMDQVQKYMDGPRLLRMRLGELVPHSLGWSCALGVRG